MNQHIAKSIDEVNIVEYDLIITLTSYHKICIESLYPNVKNKVFTLKEYVSPEEKYKDIDDPWGFGLDIYKSCAKEIVENIDKLIEKF